MVQSSAEFTETDVWNHFNFEGISRSTVSKSDTKIKNGGTVDHKLKSDQNRYKSQAKKRKIIEKKFQLGWISYEVCQNL